MEGVDAATADRRILLVAATNRPEASPAVLGVLFRELAAGKLTPRQAARTWTVPVAIWFCQRCGRKQLGGSCVCRSQAHCL